MAQQVIDTVGATDSLQSGGNKINANFSELYGWKDNPTLPAIAQTIVANAVDWCVYDTSKDSDGGAWRKRCQHLSWYNEALNTATRGATREFPAKALIVAESGQVTIYDLTEPTVPMWMAFTNLVDGYLRGATSITSVAMRNGVLVIGATGGLYPVWFLSDRGARYHSAITINTGTMPLGIANRNGTQQPLADNRIIVNATVNDVAITVLPDAPIDSATGLPVPTIAVATDGGVSVINDNGSVNNSTYAGPTPQVNFGFNGTLYSSSRTATSYVFYGTPADYRAGSWGTLLFNSNALNPAAILGTNHKHALNTLASANGVTLYRHNLQSRVNSLVAYLTSTYNTGWMVGDIRRCFLANSLTADRSVKGGTLTMVGTVTETVNAGGRNVYSGFSATNYLQEASHADWNNIGTGDFSIIMSGVKWGTAGNNRALFSIGSDTPISGDIELVLLSSGILSFYGHDGTTWAVRASSTATFSDTIEHTVEVKRVGSTVSILVDGVIVASGTFSTALNTVSPLRIGAYGSTATAINPWVGGQVACVRLSATAPTDEQSKFIAETENALNGGKACLLSADNVTRLTYDEDSEILGVETAAAYDYLKGLEVIQRGVAITDTTDLGFTRVQANGTTDIRVSVPAFSVRDALIDKSKRLAEAQQTPQTFGFNGDGTTTTFWLNQGWKPQSVYVGGSRKFEGSTADYTVAFDGFRYGVTFAVAPATGTNNIVIEGVRA